MAAVNVGRLISADLQAIGLDERQCVQVLSDFTGIVNNLSLGSTPEVRCKPAHLVTSPPACYCFDVATLHTIMTPFRTTLCAIHATTWNCSEGAGLPSLTYTFCNAVLIPGSGALPSVSFHIATRPVEAALPFLLSMYRTAMIRSTSC